MANSRFDGGTRGNGRWDEEEHPRGKDGRFSSSAGEDGGSDEEALSKDNTYSYTIDDSYDMSASDVQAIAKAHGLGVEHKDNGTHVISGNIDKIAGAYKEIQVGDFGTLIDAVNDLADKPVKTEREAKLAFIREIADKNKFSRRR